MSTNGPPFNPPVVCRDASLQLEDGTVLMARLWHPSSGGPWPALLMRQPYGRAIASTVTYAHPSWWAEHGFLVVVQDVRGMGDSSGQFRGFRQEATDGAATQQWVRALPECNGRLGCYGFSYQGLTQLLSSAESPPPDCLAPAMAGLNECEHWSCEGGAQWWHLGLGWGLQLAALEARHRNDHQAWLKLRTSLESNAYLRDGPALLQRHAPDGMALQWLTSDPDRREEWTVHPVAAAVLRQPMLLIGGCWDPHLNGILDLWRRARHAGGRPELHIGPATHLQWWPEAQTLMLRFFQRHLQAPPEANRLNPAQIWNVTDATWQTLDPTTVDTAVPERRGPWALRGNRVANMDNAIGGLEPGGAGQGMVTLVHDPWRPVPGIGGHLGVQPGPVDRQQLDGRSDVVTFTSQPLDEPCLLIGQPQLKLGAWADQPGFDLCVALSRLPAGSTSVEQLTTGTRRLRGETCLHNRPRHIDLQAVCATFKPGDQLRLSIAPAAWPAIGVNSGSPEVPCGAPSHDHRVVTMTLDLADSALTLNPFSSGRLDNDMIQLP
ncbi:CocE/NonD family hydrolase [Parasynechococcus sp.]|uniref:CocE/NonD family hydrolase n=1 Tax=Parasynechococcus sp. TaxID=3101203 RepID=UPI003704D2F4